MIFRIFSGVIKGCGEPRRGLRVFTVAQTELSGLQLKWVAAGNIPGKKDNAPVFQLAWDLGIFEEGGGRWKREMMDLDIEGIEAYRVRTLELRDYVS